MYQDLVKCLQKEDGFAIIAHFRPDGDAIGSSLALGLALKHMGKRVRIYNEDKLPPSFAFLEGADLLEQVPEDLRFPQDISTVICLDCGAWKRLGDHAIKFLAPDNCPATILNIDHHGSNELYGVINVVEPQQAATACIIFNIICELGCPISPAIATALYVGISTDTGSFQYGSTTAEVMRTAAFLIESGVDVQHVNRCLYQEVPLSTLMVNREVLNHMVVEFDGQISHYSIDNKRKQEMGLSLDDTKDLVEIIRVIAGVKASIIVEELADGRIRMSLRSKDPAVNVARVAQQFGGGGHFMAAGIRMSGNLDDCRNAVLEAIRQEITKSQNSQNSQI